MPGTTPANYYTLLGVSYDAKPEEIRTAYRTANQQAKGDPKRLADLNAALICLQNPACREAYDKRINVPLLKLQAAQSAPPGQPPTDPSDHTVILKPSERAPVPGDEGATQVAPRPDATILRPAQPKAYLEVVNPADGKCEVYNLVSRVTTIGRASANDIVILDGYVSRQHARVEVADGCFCVVDCGSRNRTWVGGQPLEKEVKCPLHDGDCFVIEGRRCTLHIGAKPK